MLAQERIINAIFAAIDDINQQLPPEQRIIKTLQAPLFSDIANLDSLGFISLIVELEKRISAEFNLEINLTDESSLQEAHNVFETVQNLIEYITKLIEEKGNV